MTGSPTSFQARHYITVLYPFIKEKEIMLRPSLNGMADPGVIISSVLQAMTPQIQGDATALRDESEAGKSTCNNSACDRHGDEVSNIDSYQYAIL